MALTTTEEALVRQLLEQQAAILSLAGNEATITSKLGATKVTLADLVAASSLADADLLLTRQGTTDKSVRADIIAAYMASELGTLFAPIANPTFTGDPKAPTPAQFDNDTSVATTEFVQRALGNFAGVTSVSSATTLAAADWGKLISASSATTANFNLTLPPISGVTNGAAINFTNNSAYSVTFLPNGSDLMYVAGIGGAQASFVVLPGDSAIIYKGASFTVVIGGSSQLKYAGVFGSSLAGNGYQKLPSGLIIQWGVTATTAADTGIAVTLPIAYPNSPLIAFCSALNSGSSAYADNVCQIVSQTTTTLNLFVNAVSLNVTAIPYNWISIGY